MKALDLMNEVASLAGYTISGSSGQDVSNKARALRRINIVKADIISRFGGKWPSQYREGWLPLVSLINIGVASVTQNNTIVSLLTNTTLPIAGSKFLGPDGSYYRIAYVSSASLIYLITPYQGTTVSGTYQIWQDEYQLYPEVLSIGGFVDYQLQEIMSEAYPRNMKLSYPYPVNVENPNVFTVIGRSLYSDITYPSLGVSNTISGTINTNILTLDNGSFGNSFLNNNLSIQPGMTVTLNGTDNYIIKEVGFTTLLLYQNLTSTYTSAVVTIKGKNPLKVRFKEPTVQKIVHYWYWAKSANLINDNDEDWICEIYPEVIILGAVVKDYIDKNDVARANMSKITYENAIKDMMISETGAMTGVRTVAYDIPPEARD